LRPTCATDRQLLRNRRDTLPTPGAGRILRSPVPSSRSKKEKVMWQRFGLAACLLLVPHVARAQEGPERLLPAGTQIYLRWDGALGQRAAFEKSALGKTLRGDTGKFLIGLLRYTREQLFPLLSNQVNPQTLEKIADDTGKFLDVLGKHGFVLGIE